MGNELQSENVYYSEAKVEAKQDEGISNSEASVHAKFVDQIFSRLDWAIGLSEGSAINGNLNIIPLCTIEIIAIKLVDNDTFNKVPRKRTPIGPEHVGVLLVARNEEAC